MHDWLLLRFEAEAAFFVINALRVDGLLMSRPDEHGPKRPLMPTWKAYVRLKQLESSGYSSSRAFALGLGRKVIWMCHDSDNDNLHFDTRQFNHIMYTDHEWARKQLTARIVALEGEGLDKAAQ